MQITVRPLDLSADADLEQVRSLLQAVDEDAFGASEQYTLPQMRASFTSSSAWQVGQWIAEVESLEGGRVVGGLLGVLTPQLENLDAATVMIDVHPALRGHGIGTALLERAALPAVQAAGRTLISAYGTVPVEGDADDATLPANRLAARAGLERRSLAVCRSLDLPLAPGLLDELAAEVDERIGDYRVASFLDEIPEEQLAEYGRLMAQLDLDDPDEDVESEVPDYTPERIRENAERRRRAGKHTVICVAMAPDGSMAGNCEIVYRDCPGSTLGWQENTLVMPDHRGHRLGLALKVEAHRRLVEAAPGLRRVVTWNSHVNPWMISINEKLGYRPRCREVAYQGRACFDGAMDTAPEGTGRVVSASREIAADAATIFALIADPARQVEWDGNDNLAAAESGHPIREVGDDFVVTLTKGVDRHNRVVEFEQDRRLAWRPGEADGTAFGQLWRWELEPVGEGRTLVTHTYDWTQLTEPPARIERARSTTPDKLRASIDRLAELAESA